MYKVQTLLRYQHSLGKKDQDLARSDIFEYPLEMSIGDWLNTLPGSVTIRTAAFVVRTLTRWEIQTLGKIVPETIGPAIQSFLDSLHNAPTTKEVSITRVLSWDYKGTYIDLSPRELAQRIGLPFHVDEAGDDQQVSDAAERLLFSSLSSLRGWEVITQKSDGTKRRDIRFFRKNT